MIFLDTRREIYLSALFRHIFRRCIIRNFGANDLGILMFKKSYFYSTVSELHYPASTNVIIGYSYIVVGLSVMECSRGPYNVIIIKWCMAMCFNERVAKKTSF